MKNLKFITLAAILFCALTVNAQKTAHLNLDSVISLMPESAKAKEAVAAYAKQLDDELVSMQKELETKIAEYQKEKGNWLPAILELRQSEIQSMQERIQIYQQSAQETYEKKLGELSKPIYEKAKKAAEEVAKAAGYKYVLDTSTGLVLFSDPADDILNLVLKKLGITPPPANTGAGTTTAPKQDK